MRKLPLGILGAGLTAALMVMTACGSSSNPVTPGKDSGAHDSAAGDSAMGMDSTMPPSDSGMGSDTTMMGSDTAPPPDSGMMAETGGDGGPCNFATVVLGLIANDTNAMASPVPISAVTGCTDDMNQMDFASLFP